MRPFVSFVYAFVFVSIRGANPVRRVRIRWLAHNLVFGLLLVRAAILLVLVLPPRREPLPRVVFHRLDEVLDRLAPPVRDEPLRPLGLDAWRRHQLHVATLPLLRLRLDEVLRDVVQVDGVRVAGLAVEVLPALEVAVLISKAGDLGPEVAKLL